MIPTAPDIPPALQAKLTDLRAEMAEAGLIRELPSESASWWNEIVDQWAEAEDLPLIVRRNSHRQMCMRLAMPGRPGGVVPSDNSPAHWMVMRCFEGGARPTLSLVRSLQHEIPMTMRMSAKEALECDFPKRLDDSEDHAGISGWYLAHIEPVGLGRIGKTALENLPHHVLEDRFRLLMRPSNMILIARTISGLAGIDGWIG